MLTRLQPDLPVAPPIAPLSGAGNSNITTKVAKLETKVSELVEQNQQLLAALKGMWDTLNRDGAIAISGGTIADTPISGSTGSFTTLSASGLITATGGQISFPATQVPSANANTLDDYEEGTWVPSVGGNATYTTQTGFYTKIGRLVIVSGSLVINVIGTGSTGTISGLPFTAAQEADCAIGYWTGSATNYASLLGFISSGTTSITLAAIAAGGAAGTGAATFFANAATIGFAAAYIV